MSLETSVASAAALLVASACGTYSDTDIPYLEAVPTNLAIALPQGGEAGCPNPSDLAADAQSAGDSINSSIERVVELLDLILQVSPSARTADSRTWGPFADKAHAGFELQMAMTKSADGGVYTVELQERGKTGAFVSILDGELDGATAANGSGTLTLHFDSLRTLGLNQPGDPLRPMTVTYDFTADPKVITLTLSDTFGVLPAFTYDWSGFANGDAEFTYEVTARDGGTLVIPAFFSARGAGSAVVTYTPASGAASTLTECWDNAFCVSYVDDPTDVTERCSSSPCDLGSASLCVMAP